MKRWIYLVAFGIFGVFASNAALAGYLDGNQLKEFLIADNNVLHGKPDGSGNGTMVGTGYIMGIIDVGNGVSYCVPATANAGQVSSVVLKFLRDNPAQLGHPAATLVGRALFRTFPCPIGFGR